LEKAARFRRLAHDVGDERARCVFIELAAEYEAKAADLGAALAAKLRCSSALF
jgi:hypothetical protein